MRAHNSHLKTFICPTGIDSSLGKTKSWNEFEFGYWFHVIVLEHGQMLWRRQNVDRVDCFNMFGRRILLDGYVILFV